MILISSLNCLEKTHLIAIGKLSEKDEEQILPYVSVSDNKLVP